ncbi:hypothetical protein [Streptomyces sp. ICC4]|uniref:hypothetical protein n=1 Tax=Streptomyces sp. ICC4 TaxID=2099584 RepID=UPI000DC7CF01|nr:hypothetical protein [Streptomyces sp. ICC4]AWZ08736.1 hypothetical protein DRB89_34005 [Streptomyces sp. ICC4]
MPDGSAGALVAGTEAGFRAGPAPGPPEQPLASRPPTSRPPTSRPPTSRVGTAPDVLPPAFMARSLRTRE